MKRKIYYIPGAISLIMLPIMVLYWLHDREENRLYTLEVVFPGRDDQFKAPDRKYVSIELNDRPQDNLVKLAYGEILIREQKLMNDTVRGVHFHFGRGCRYSNFVQVINLIEKHEVMMALPQLPDVWIAERPIRKTLTMYGCGGSRFVNHYEEGIPETERTKVVVTSIFILALTTLSFFKLRKLKSTAASIPNT